MKGDEGSTLVARWKHLAVIEGQGIRGPMRGKCGDRPQLRGAAANLLSISAVLGSQHQPRRGRVVVAVRPAVIPAFTNPEQLFRREIGALLPVEQLRPVLTQLVPTVLGG